MPSFARRMLQQDKLPFFGPPYLRVRLSVSVCLGLSVCPCERCSKTSVKMHQNLITWIRSKRWMYLLHQISSEENHPQAKNVFESRRLVFKITTFDFSCAEYVNNKFLHVSNPFTLFLTIYQCSWPHAALLSHFLGRAKKMEDHIKHPVQCPTLHVQSTCTLAFFIVICFKLREQTFVPIILLTGDTSALALAKSLNVSLCQCAVRLDCTVHLTMCWYTSHPSLDALTEETLLRNKQLHRDCPWHCSIRSKIGVSIAAN